MPVTAKTPSSSAVTCYSHLSHQYLQYKKTDRYLLPLVYQHKCFPLQNANVSLYTSSSLAQAQQGFTLVEIVVVVVILSIFAGMMSLSVGSSESRKNRAFYEHLTDSLSYVRLLSAERMQPMGLSLQADKQGQVKPVIVTLSNPYIAYQTNDIPSNSMDSTPKNSMELSADLTSMSGAIGKQQPVPSWEIEPEVSLPELPAGVSLRVQSLEAGNLSMPEQEQTLQPWFANQAVPQILWFGTGQATPVTIEVLHNSRLVGEVITIMPDGSMTIGQGL
ncbi:prepilin-type N-terminal cleavage/methylation domain-containing protein [Psychrobacter aquimaris]|uniref:prepilin-type N-terminal cleavage/methylation domain-containing protein n=1 Tax=Psychrobacter aquimaris TaxID=292733 RepID=UPI001D10F53C|nr:prepilin-type N-terminal cleavage/methylation domain-containing protein [Psychrobacter aquimaris]